MPSWVRLQFFPIISSEKPNSNEMNRTFSTADDRWRVEWICLRQKWIVQSRKSDEEWRSLQALNWKESQFQRRKKKEKSFDHTSISKRRINSNVSRMKCKRKDYFLLTESGDWSARVLSRQVKYEYSDHKSQYFFFFRRSSWSHSQF
jgi:hypothetical protein